MSQVMSQAALDAVVAHLLQNPFMSKVTEENKQLCWDILATEGDDPGTRQSEDHLFTPAVQEAAQRLMDEEGVSSTELLQEGGKQTA